MNMLLEIDALAIFIDVVKFAIPALIVFAVSYKLLSKFLDDNAHSRLIEVKKEQSAMITPIRLQAYERLTIFLDRISPDNLVLRLSKSGQSAGELRALLIRTITDEFNHNISQQIYVSNQAWIMVKAVKEQIIGIVDSCYRECDEDASGPTLGKMVLTRLMESKEVPTQKAIEYLKREIEIVL
ncbi:hypothetical protein GYB22_06340 [bacterium]|nr:hypothetical protein [bacterium]